MLFSELSQKIRMAGRGPSAAEIATVAVIWDGKILMGLRRDNGKWTFPGGHLDPGERPEEGAKRELWEEAGIIGHVLYKLGSESIVTFSGKAITVHAYQLETYLRPTTLDNDPDGEIERWEWVELEGAEQLKPENLHSPKNVLLKLLGVQTW